MTGTNAQPVSGGTEPVSEIGWPQCGQRMLPFVVSPIFIALIAPERCCSINLMTGNDEQTKGL
jgi:hypothetical protein